VASWLGHGENLPITADHVTAAIPPATLAGWAAESGLPPEQLPGLLAEVLPHAVDHVTPGGEAAPGKTGELPEGTLHALVSRLFGR
jgi:uncharacterized protein YidB (DUF937 family)